MAVIVSVIAVLVALGCFIAIAMSDFRGTKKKKSETADGGSSPPQDREKQ